VNDDVVFVGYISQQSRNTISQRDVQKEICTGTDEEKAFRAGKVSLEAKCTLLLRGPLVLPYRDCTLLFYGSMICLKQDIFSLQMGPHAVKCIICVSWVWYSYFLRHDYGYLVPLPLNLKTSFLQLWQWPSSPSFPFYSYSTRLVSCLVDYKISLTLEESLQDRE
jgi:hypothetical protein